MAFRFHSDNQSLSALVSNDPAQALERLQELFAEHRTRAAVAKHLMVDERTLARWITRLTSAGYADPRDASGAPRRGKATAAA